MDNKVSCPYWETGKEAVMGSKKLTKNQQDKLRIAEIKALIARCKEANDPDSLWALALLNQMLKRIRDAARKRKKTLH